MDGERLKGVHQRRSRRALIPNRARCLLMVGSALWVLAWTNNAQAATDTENLTVNATVSATATLTLGSASINFASANPATTASIGATENPVSVTVNAQTGSSGNVTLTCVAGGDLTSGSDTIAISNVTWTATGSGFAAGTMSKTTAQSAGSWTGPGTRSGTFSFFLANSWSYVTGSYTATVTYTLTSP